MTSGLMSTNPNPTVYSSAEYVRVEPDDIDSPEREPIDALEIYERIKDIQDPEHPLSLAQLRIVTPQDISVDDAEGSVDVTFTPTVPNCQMPAILGLCIHEKLLRVLPLRFHSKIRVKCAPGSHIQADAITRQLGDKERCLAALERGNLRDMIERCIYASS